MKYFAISNYGEGEIMSMFFCSVGRSVRIPLLDPENEVYLQRVKLLGSYVSNIVGIWENHCDADMDCDLPKQLAYTLRRLAEMLCYPDFDRITRQNFYKKASMAAQRRNGKDSVKAMKILCAGLADIQNRLDFGLSPFSEGISSEIEVIYRKGDSGVSGEKASPSSFHSEIPLFFIKQ